MTAVILAGGLGTRLKERISDLPKPMAPVRGIPFLEYQVTHLEKNGFRHIILSTGHLYQKIMDHFGSSFGNCKVSYTVEKEPLGTGGGLKYASHLVEDDFFIMLNGDTWVDWDIPKCLEIHQSNRASATLLLRPQLDPNRYTGVVLEDQIITRFVPKGEPSNWLVAGAYCFDKKLFEELPFEGNFSLEKDAYPWMHSNGKIICGLPTPKEDHFIDIGIPEDYDRAHTILPRLSIERF